VELSEVVAGLDGLATTDFDDHAYRHSSVGGDPLSGEGARLVSGRWNPPESFAVLYLGGDVATVAREFERLARSRSAPLTSSCRATCSRMSSGSSTSSLSASASMQPPSGWSQRTSPTMTSRGASVGEGVHSAGFEGLIAPGATGKRKSWRCSSDARFRVSVVRAVASERWAGPPG
jgi:RES domain-containing protein